MIHEFIPWMAKPFQIGPILGRNLQELSSKGKADKSENDIIASPDSSHIHLKDGWMACNFTSFSYIRTMGG